MWDQILLHQAKHSSGKDRPHTVIHTGPPNLLVVSALAGDCSIRSAGGAGVAEDMSSDASLISKVAGVYTARPADGPFVDLSTLFCTVEAV